MKSGLRLLTFGAGLTLGGAIGAAQTAAQPAGHWQGKIQIPDHELGITVDLDRNSKAMWIGSISVTGTTSIDVPLTDITAEGTTVRFTARLPERAAFAGELSADGSSLSGKASNNAGDASFQLARSGEAKVNLPPPSTTLSKDFEGAWEGTLDVGGKARRIGLKLWTAADGTAAAALVASAEQGILEIPVTTVTIKDKQVLLESRSVSGTYNGMLSTGGDIAGEWAQGPNHLPLNFKRASTERK